MTKYFKIMFITVVMLYFVKALILVKDNSSVWDCFASKEKFE